MRKMDEVSDQDSLTYPYPWIYQPKSIFRQIREVALFFDIDPRPAFKLAKSLSPPSAGTEAWFALPRWQAVAGSYGKALEKALSLIERQRRLHSWMEKEKFGKNYLKEHNRTARSLRILTERQPGSDILIVSCQFGFFYWVSNGFRENEFSLGYFPVACMLLTHPERLTKLWFGNRIYLKDRLLAEKGGIKN